MNVRKIIFSVLSMMLVLRPSLVVAFDPWPGKEFDIIKVYETDGTVGLVVCEEDDNNFDDLAWWHNQSSSNSLMILGKVDLYNDDYEGEDHKGSYNANWLMYCSDDGNDQYHFKHNVKMEGSLGRLLGDQLKTIQGAQYRYNGTLVWEPSKTPSGFIRDTNPNYPWIDVSCPDGTVYDGSKCADYSSLEFGCRTTEVRSLLNQGLKSGDLRVIDGFLYPGEENQKRFLQSTMSSGSGFVCRLKGDKYLTDGFWQEQGKYCKEEQIVFDPAETSAVYYKCDKTEGWKKTILKNCGNNVDVGYPRLLALEDETYDYENDRAASCGDVHKCKAGWHKEKNCGYLYCADGYVPSPDEKSCMTRNELENRIQEGEQTANNVFDNSLDACRRVFDAYKEAKNTCKSSGGTVSADTSKTKWIGPKCVEDEKDCNRTNIEPDWLEDSDLTIIISHNVQKKAKKIKPCDYEIVCDCDKDTRYLENPSNDDDYCQCLGGYVPKDSNNMAEGCKQGSRQDCQVAEAAQRSSKIKPKWDADRCVCVYDDYASGEPDIKYYVLDSDYKCVPTIDLAICLPLIANKHAEWDNSVGKCKCLERDDLEYFFVNGQCLETQESVMAREIELSEQRLNAIRESNQTVYDKYDAMISPIRERAKQGIGDAYAKLEELRGDFKTSVWKNKEGKFNTARLLSDSVAGIALGTVGGVVTHNVVEKNQLEDGFEDLKCTVAGQEVARFDEVFQAGIQ